MAAVPPWEKNLKEIGEEAAAAASARCSTLHKLTMQQAHAYEAQVMCEVAGKDHAKQHRYS